MDAYICLNCGGNLDRIEGDYPKLALGELSLIAKS